MRRRIPLLGVVTTATFVLFLQAAAAVEPTKAEAFIRSLADRALAVIKAENLTRTEQSKQLRDILRDHFDVKTIGNFALGVHRRQASEQQLSDYLAEFEDYIVYTYSSRLGQFAGEQLDVIDTRPAGSAQTDIFVMSEIVREGRQPIPLIWRLREQNGRLQVIDIEIEGTNQILAYRQEFAAVVKNRRQGVDGLIAELREKNASLQSKLAANQ